LYGRQWDDKPLNSLSALTKRRDFQRGTASLQVSQVSVAVLLASRIGTNAVALGFTSVL
jgi:hypothetical protein